MFKRSPSLTEQTKAYIKERIVNDEFEGGRIPSEMELANALGAQPYHDSRGVEPVGGRGNGGAQAGGRDICE